MPEEPNTQTPLTPEPETPATSTTPVADEAPPIPAHLSDMLGPMPTPPESESTMSTPPAAENVTPAAPAPPVVMQMKSKKPLIIIGAAVAVALLLGGGYVFGFYLPNTPDSVFSAGLTNTGTLVDGLISYSKDQQAISYKSANFDSTIKVTGGLSVDATLTGALGTDANATAALTADIAGQHATINLRSVRSAGNATPDLYLQETGLGSVLKSLGIADGQWISIDHTLIDSVKHQAGSGSSGGLVMASTAPTYAQLQDAATKIQVVNRQYLFTTNSSKAVITEQQFVAQEAVAGRAQDHYKVSYNKANYIAYVGALGDAIDQSTLNDWSKSANGGKSLSAVLDIAGMKQDIQKAKTNYTFDLWVDASSKLVSKISLVNPDDASQVITIGQGYTGTGTNYPLTLNFKGNSAGQITDMTVSAAVDTVTNKVTISLNGSNSGSGSTSSLDVVIHATPSTKAITVTAPTGTTSLNSLLGPLLGGGGTSGLSGISL